MQYQNLQQMMVPFWGNCVELVVKASFNTANFVRTDGCGVDLTGSLCGQVAATRECGCDPFLGSINFKEFFE